MSYLNFFIKRVFKSTLTLLMTGTILMLFIFILAMNIRTYRSFSIASNANDNLQIAKRLRAASKNDLSVYDKNSDRYESALGNYHDAQASIEKNTKLIDALHAGRYQEAYAVALSQTDASLKMAKGDPATTPDLLTGLKREQLRLKALAKADLPEQSSTYPVDGLGFVANLLRYIAPVVFCVLVIFLLSQVFSERYREGIDIGAVFPFRILSLSAVDSLAGVLVCVGLVVAMIGLVLGLATIISGFGHWSYPMFRYHSGTSKMEYVSTGTIILQQLPISLLYLVFLVLSCEVIAIMAKNRFVTLFVALVVLIGLPLGTWLVVPLQSIAHIVPTTYLFSELTVTGELANSFHNSRVCLTSGLIVLLGSILILAVLIVALGQKKKKFQSEASRIVSK
ncbi:hypothetical protein [Lacticaseibacillus mingshuiensis]|uniref:ABC transporter permease n=1 Tax=Lacticaseibacillus mingshuiensis TaxID=2799574 RepID=A0ABW4CHR2_9LACO|nr:hypothetical protein [Lacticaseibacillus mingshuiensis]